MSYFERNHTHQGLEVDGSPPITIENITGYASSSRHGSFSRATSTGDTVVVTAGTEMSIYDGIYYRNCYDSTGATVTDGTGTSTTKYLYASYDSTYGLVWSLSATAAVWSSTHGYWIMGTNPLYRWMGAKFDKSSTSAFYVIRATGNGDRKIWVKYNDGQTVTTARHKKRTGASTANTAYSVDITAWADDNILGAEMVLAFAVASAATVLVSVHEDATAFNGDVARVQSYANLTGGAIVKCEMKVTTFYVTSQVTTTEYGVYVIGIFASF